MLFWYNFGFIQNTRFYFLFPLTFNLLVSALNSWLLETILSLEFVDLFSYTLRFNNSILSDLEDKNIVGVECGPLKLFGTIKFNINRLEPCEAMLENSIH